MTSRFAIEYGLSSGFLVTQAPSNRLASHALYKRDVFVKGQAPGASKVDASTSSVTERKNPELFSMIDEGVNATQPSKRLGASKNPKPEVLSPAGGWPQLYAAVENGADAVYFGLTAFNARARAANFLPEELPAVMTYLHDRGVKGFVVLNVLVFDEELAAVEELVRGMAVAGAWPWPWRWRWL
jgi:hypothetical protein